MAEAKENMMDTPQKEISTYVLKVLSGPHIGAEIPLDFGTYTIGKSDACDVILRDEFIADQQLTLTLDKNSIKLSAAKENTSLAGTYLDGSDAAINLFDVVGIGATFFALGAPDHAWPALNVPDKVSYKTQPVVEEQAEEEAPPHKVTVDADASHLKKRYASTMSFFSDQAPKTQIGMAVGASIAFGLLLIVLFYFIISDLSSGPKYSANEEIQKATEIVKTLGIEKDLVISGPVEGIVIIKGYVDNQEAQTKLKAALTKAEIPNQLNIYSNAKILESIKNVLHTKNMDLKVVSHGNGAVLLEGVVNAQSQIRNITKAIQTDVPGVRNIQTEILVREDLYNSLEAILTKYELGQLVTLLINEADITAQGDLTQNQMIRWDNAKAEINTLLPDVFKLFDKINGTKNKSSTAILKVQLWGVNLTASPPYIVFLDGTKYSVGDKIDADLEITDIKKDGIYLIYRKNKLFYDYTKKVQWIVE